MSERDHVESVVATIDRVQEVVISAVGSTEHLQLEFANNVTPQQHDNWRSIQPAIQPDDAIELTLMLHYIT